MKRLVLSISIVLSCLLSIAQVPQGFNYQAIAHDGVNPITITLPIKITIQSEPTGGTIFWEEIHSTVTPNESGLFTLVVGAGVKQPASTIATFPEINWSVTPKYIKTEIDYGGWQDMGSAALWAVPYSMLAKNLEGPVEKLGVTGTTTNMEEALFEVKNKDGQTIFAVYNEGVRINVADGNALTKGAKGGFAIGGFDLTKGITHDLFVVNSDSIRAYIYDDPATKTSKGGFAIGGFDLAKGTTNDYLLISPDSARIYVDNRPSAKGAKGGFAIGGFDVIKGISQKFMTVSNDSIRMYIDDGAKGAKGGFAIGGFDAAKGSMDNYLKVDVERINAGKVEYLDITPYNMFIGEYAGSNTVPTFGATPSLNTGVDNVFLGYQSGYQNTTGTKNVFIGYQSGMDNVEGMSNVFIGNQSGSNNIGIGSYKGDYNVFIGEMSGYYNNYGQSNVFIGKQSGWRNTTGNYNIYIGLNAGSNNEEGGFNTYIGGQAGVYKSGGSNNTMVGYYAGAGNATGSGNVFIGRYAGSEESGSNLLYIENSNSATPLIGGDFIANMVAINGKPDPASASFQVNGSARLGTNGTTINNVIKLTIAADIDPVAAGESLLKTFSVPDAATGSSVIASPQNALDDGMVISYARVVSTGSVEVKFRNTGTTSIDLASMNWYITVIQ